MANYPYRVSHKGPLRTDPIDRMVDQIEITDTCWLWLGSTSSGGYGKIRMDGKTVPVHRLAYEHAVGPVPIGMVLDHLCMVPSCINPDHLEPVTQQINTIRSKEARGVARHLQPHGTKRRYSIGCRCVECRSAVATYRRNLRAKGTASGRGAT